MSDKSRIDEPTGTATVGHEWDGIEELNTPLPRWWLWTFYATIAWAAVYVVLFPAWPMVNSATRGMLEWSSRGDLKAELAAQDAKRAPIAKAIAATSITDLAAKPELLEAAIQGGSAAFKVHCVQCHGAGGAGVVGAYPSLTDDDWLWGGDLAAIETTLTHGIRNPDHDETRLNMMPAFGKDGILDAAAINDLVSHVRVISRQEKPSASSARGAALFEANCVACHGPAGQGIRELGGPKLTDAVWLYGGSREAIAKTIYAPRNGVMPRWNDKLDAVTIKMLSAYVHSLGGGEDAPAPVLTAQPKGEADNG
ncbi:MAG: cytochrome-c oxidase, cbb3-type subunit III [Sphingomonadales bacterium RIFCSPHIGHO2_01_FULL_65_20]|jgi:cytochrome c oxidase cbb3-type subunit 3|uniref:cytochrome-c oxidase, cbb3-type subunit III n=1 Tax=unclassified Blastomonas TaxID=2626550 RepID=UPI00082E550A|nr:cytochrome-c oxidase, cbb3-type subunit III [Blastomonas sp.]MCH2239925.1 cytochrome-c oxidase, cbb3-type subunit III [Blastomonas sp.]OHC92078.1 MAG: cytochrome-c oxidase, cbb3-type subunit III [Sphingomonadales bacterium RIFCSPHIGHO2_01_FULL_65_20]